MRRDTPTRYFAKPVRGDTLAVLCTGIVSAILAVRFQAFEALIDIVEDYERWQLDEVFSVLIILGMAGIIISVRRGRELGAEILRREASEEQASAMARHDPLTGLPNRRVISEHFAQVTQRVRATGQEVAVLLVDLDRFKPVNDIHGHGAGDKVLIEVAGRLQRLVEVTGGAMLARLGGDEFALVLEYNAGTDAPVRLANQVVHLASDAIDVGTRSVQVGASVGIATGDGATRDVDELLRMADVAMYRAKRDGRSTFRSFEEEMDAELQLRSQLEAELREAIPAGEIVPFYQPIMSLPDQALVGFESLARWIHPVRGVIPPDGFIPIAEDSGLIDELTFSLLRQACADARNWPPHITLSINISAVQLSEEWLPEKILQIITEAGFAPGRLIVELTESGIVADLDAARTIIASLKNAGVKVALDDFGTGYSSLSHLRELQFDSIKIDRSFVKNMDASRDGELVKAIIGMGHSLGMPVTAEGVETEGSLSALVDLQCNRVQGFLLGRPTSATEAMNLLALQTGTPAPLRLASSRR